MIKALLTYGAHEPLGENPRWGYLRIVGELRKLGVTLVPSARSAQPSLEAQWVGRPDGGDRSNVSEQGNDASEGSSRA